MKFSRHDPKPPLPTYNFEDLTFDETLVLQWALQNYVDSFAKCETVTLVSNRNVALELLAAMRKVA